MLCSLCAGGCHADKQGSAVPGGKIILARAGNEHLYLSDMADLIPKAISRSDSAAFVQRYADTWVRKQLLLAHAATESETEEIEKQVDDYRQYLLLQSFQNQYVNKNLDTNIARHEITDYYHNNPENFVLQQHVIRAWLIAVPKNTPGLDKARNWMISGDSRGRKELQSFGYRFANFYHFDDSTWIAFDELVRNTPFRETADPVRFLKNNRFAETSDEQNVYLLSVKEYKLSSQPAPLAFIEPQVREILINRRKVKLIQELEKKIYEEAAQKKEFEIITR